MDGMQDISGMRTEMQVKTVFFDLDGTLTRSGDGIVRCAQWAVQEMHWQTMPDDWERFIGPPLFDSFRNLCGMDAAQADEAVRLYRERFTRIGWEENEVYAGIPCLLRSLIRNGIKPVIVTSKPGALTERIVDRFCLRPMIYGVIAPGMGERHPEKEKLIRQGMDRFDGPYVMVGDRIFDIDGAKACGIPSIFAGYGYGTQDEARDAWGSADSPDEIAALLLGDLPRAPGLFFSMEGVDGCGKSTQQAALVEEMRRLGWHITMTREPGGDEVAEKIRGLILDPANSEIRDVTEAYLYAASRAQNARALIQPAIARGDLVICDRYVDSSIAYQGGGRGLGTDRIRELNAWATEHCMPDLTIYLRMEPHEALARRLNVSVPDRLEREKESFFERTFEAYEALYGGPDGARAVTVNAGGSIEDVTREMLTKVRARLSEIAADGLCGDR